MNVNVYLAC